MGPWRDEDADDTLDWAPGDERNTLHLDAGEQIRVAMRWPDEWGAASNDYDIALLQRRHGRRLGQRLPGRRGRPVRGLRLRGGDRRRLRPARPPLRGRARDADPDPDLHVGAARDGAPRRGRDTAVAGRQREPRDGLRRGGPAHRPDVIEPYSSRGPTVDGRVKPDLVATDCMATVTYGLFCGTSAAAPLTTGAAALALEADPTLGPVELAERLRSTALADRRPGAQQHVRGGPAAASARRCRMRPDRRRVGLRAGARVGHLALRGDLDGDAVAADPGRAAGPVPVVGDGSNGPSVGSAESENGRTADSTIAPVATRRYRAVALGTAVTSSQVTIGGPPAAERPAVDRTRRERRPARRAGRRPDHPRERRPAGASDLPRAVVEYAIYERIGSRVGARPADRDHRGQRGAWRGYRSISTSRASGTSGRARRRRPVRPRARGARSSGTTSGAARREPW